MSSQETKAKLFAIAVLALALFGSFVFLLYIANVIFEKAKSRISTIQETHITTDSPRHVSYSYGAIPLDKMLEEIDNIFQRPPSFRNNSPG
ncbi:hypothetical protein CL630_01195 [bacterium]|mgnify:CR=1 FL=1|nr:hypothetical protein [bacterium]|tara:strand:+ start:3407 stop:3679 length:273 start_codon:yes stop_codon:yes gene_type:complete